MSLNLISLLCVLAVYVLSFLFVKLKVYTVLIHRKIWNTLLLLSFIALLVTVVNMFMANEFQKPFLGRGFWFLHSLAGSVFSLIAFFHVVDHLWYFKNLIIRPKPNVTKN